jgi:hypothetical protein
MVAILQYLGLTYSTKKVLLVKVEAQQCQHLIFQKNYVYKMK